MSGTGRYFDGQGYGTGNGGYNNETLVYVEGKKRAREKKNGGTQERVKGGIED